MAPNDDALLIGGGLILLAIIAMGGGGDGEKATEIIVVPPADPPSVAMDTDDPGDIGFNKQKPKPSQTQPMSAQQARQESIQRQMLDELNDFRHTWNDLNTRVKEGWSRITQDQLKHRILHPGTDEYISVLMADMNKFIANVQAFPGKYNTTIQAVSPEMAPGFAEAVEVTQKMWHVLNKLRAASRAQRDNQFIQDMNELQEILVKRLNVQRLVYEIGRKGASLNPQEEDESFGDDARDDFNRGGKKLVSDGSVDLTSTTDPKTKAPKVHLSFGGGNTDGNTAHQNVSGQTAQPSQGTSNSTMNPGADLKSSMDAHTVAKPGSVAQDSKVLGPSNLSGKNSLEDTNSGKKGKGGMTLVEGVAEETEPGSKRQEPDTDEPGSAKEQQEGVSVSKKDKPDDLETAQNTFTAKVKNEADTVVEAFSSGGLHETAPVNPQVQVFDWSASWMKQLDAREYAPLKNWFQKQIDATKSNEIAYESAESQGISPRLIRKNQRVIQVKQQAIVALFSEGDRLETKEIIVRLNPDYYGDTEHGGWPMYMMGHYASLWAKHREKNTFENASNYIASIDVSNLKAAQRKAVKTYTPQSAAIFCMFRHTAMAANSVIVLGKRTSKQRAQTDAPTPKRQKKKTPPGKDDL